MSVNDILGYIFTTISFLSVVYAVFGNRTGPYACLLIILALLSFCYFAYYIQIVKNKTYTLQILSRENRHLCIRLLLTYERLTRSKDEFTEKFYPSRLHVYGAHYHYEILQSDSRIKDLKCIFEFHIKKIPKKQRAIDILIAQPRGKKLNTIRYKFNEEKMERVSDVTPIAFTHCPTDFQGFWKANIPLDHADNIRSITVSFTLKEVHSITRNEYGAFLLCPFIYAKKIDWFDVDIKYPDDPTYQPSTVCLKCYPYDGKKYRPETLKGFETSDKSLWTIRHSMCVSTAIYLIETHNPPA